MFYCKECGEKKRWPIFAWMFTSFGPCEVCGKMKVCHDIPSSELVEMPDLDVEEECL